MALLVAIYSVNRKLHKSAQHILTKALHIQTTKTCVSR